MEFFWSGNNEHGEQVGGGHEGTGLVTVTSSSPRRNHDTCPQPPRDDINTLSTHTTPLCATHHTPHLDHNMTPAPFAA